MAHELDANVARFSGFADVYDAVRPRLPDVAIDVLCEAAERPVPSLVVDLGSGTGLSSRIWIGRAARIVGIEPNDDMRVQAVSATPAGAVDFRAGHAEATGLPEACADIVTVGQALHWMDPPRVLDEAARLLRPGGVFAAYDCDWPPFVHWRLIDAWQRVRNAAERRVEEQELAPGLHRAEKTQHLDALRRSGHFVVATETCFHLRTSGTADQLVSLLRSQGGVATALKAHDAEIVAQLGAFAEQAQTLLGQRAVPWTYTYRMRWGVRSLATAAQS